MPMRHNFFSGSEFVETPKWRLQPLCRSVLGDDCDKDYMHTERKKRTKILLGAAVALMLCVASLLNAKHSLYS